MYLNTNCTKSCSNDKLKSESVMNLIIMKNVLFFWFWGGGGGGGGGGKALLKLGYNTKCIQADWSTL